MIINTTYSDNKYN